MTILMFNILCAFTAIVAAKEHVIRGVQPSNIALYDASRDFRCLDGSQTIPFAHINDDYCDCRDGSDEPGTSACPNGYFYCPNAGYKPSVVPSSRVNDGICDCCDGSDEYTGRVQCSNDCLRLGELLRQEEERLFKMKIEGFEVYLQYVQQGRDSRITKQARLEELEKDRDTVDMERATLEQVKSTAEHPEKEAKERHEKAWEEEKERRKSERRIVEAQEAFSDLDINDDNKVSLSEIQQRLEFDIDSSGDVSLDEAKEYLEENDEVSFDVFLEKIWDNIREIYRQPSEDQTESSETVPTTSSPVDMDVEEHDNLDDDQDEEPTDEDDDDDDDDDYDDYPEDDKTSSEDVKKVQDEDQMPDYDDETKLLIAAADEARERYNTVDSRFREIENEIRDTRKVLELDLGPNGEYFPLLDQCFDYTDREYTYSLCPFDRASQRPKHGGSETSLGKWGSWTGLGAQKHSQMKYEHGQNCWNGPDRSAEVVIECGLNNELVSVSEPNRCEYRFLFHTPAACSEQPKPLPPHTVHSEL